MTIMQSDNLQELGQILTEAREAQQLSIELVSEHIRISKTYLHALETGDWQVLPTEVYGYGYLRRYAELLKLPQDDLVAMAKKHLGTPPAKRHIRTSISNSPLPSQQTIFWVIAFFIGVLLAWQFSLMSENTVEQKIQAPPAFQFDSARTTLNPTPYNCTQLLYRTPPPCYYDYTIKKEETLILSIAYKALSNIPEGSDVRFSLHP